MESILNNSRVAVLNQSVSQVETYNRLVDRLTLPTDSVSYLCIGENASGDSLLTFRCISRFFVYPRAFCVCSFYFRQLRTCSSRAFIQFESSKRSVNERISLFNFPIRVFDLFAFSPGFFFFFFERAVIVLYRKYLADPKQSQAVCR